MPLKCSNNAQCFCLTKMLKKMLAYCTKAYISYINDDRIISEALSELPESSPIPLTLRKLAKITRSKMYLFWEAIWRAQICFLLDVLDIKTQEICYLFQSRISFWRDSWSFHKVFCDKQESWYGRGWEEWGMNTGDKKTPVTPPMGFKTVCKCPSLGTIPDLSFLEKA